MPLDSVIQKILREGSAERDEVIDAAKREVDALLRETREKGQQDVSRRIEEATRAAERLKVQEIARAGLESRKTVLATQKEVLDAVRAEALRRLSLPESRTALLRSLLETHRDSWQAGKVYCAAGDQKQVKAIVGSRLGGTIECSGGVVIESGDGTERLDLTFESLLQDIWEDSVKEMVGILWPR